MQSHISLSNLTTAQWCKIKITIIIFWFLWLSFNICFLRPKQPVRASWTQTFEIPFPDRTALDLLHLSTTTTTTALPMRLDNAAASTSGSSRRAGVPARLTSQCFIYLFIYWIGQLWTHIDKWLGVTIPPPVGWWWWWVIFNLTSDQVWPTLASRGGSNQSSDQLHLPSSSSPPPQPPSPCSSLFLSCRRGRFFTPPLLCSWAAPQWMNWCTVSHHHLSAGYPFAFIPNIWICWEGAFWGVEEERSERGKWHSAWCSSCSCGSLSSRPQAFPIKLTSVSQRFAELSDCRPRVLYEWQIKCVISSCFIQETCARSFAQLDFLCWKPNASA